MMRLGRRASLIVAFSLLASAATAYAECAWVLWIRTSPTDVTGTIAGAWTPWVTFGATTGAKGCDNLVPRDDAKRERAVEATGLVLKEGQSVNVRWQCLPDTVDPRGPKGK
jgi:hypothetical protein